MKPASPALQSLLASRQFHAADLYTFTLVGGGVLRYGGGDRDITAGGDFFPAGGQTGPYFDRTGSKAKCHWKIGTAVDTLVFDVMPGSAMALGESFLAAVRRGLFDGAEVQLARAFMPSYGDTSAGIVVLFVGRVAEIEAGRSVATFSVNSPLELLDIQMPRNLWQPGCVNSLGDASCGVDLATFAVAGTALAGSTAGVISADIASAVAGYFDQGKLTFTSGALAGLSRSVKQCRFGAPGTIGLMAPFPSAPNAGDAFAIYPGCDKTLGANGCPKFANQARFRGFPFIPVPETAV